MLAILSLCFLYVSYHLYSGIISVFHTGLGVKILIYATITILGQLFWIPAIALFKYSIYLENRLLNIFYFVLVVFLYLFFFYAISDILRLFRLNIYNWHFCHLGFIGLALLLYLIGHVNRYNIRKTEYSITSNKDVQLKIAFMSDLHIGSYGTNKKIINRAIDIINSKNVDLVLLGGDIVDAKLEPFQEEHYAELFKNIKSKYGIYAVVGNHEYYNKDYHEVAETISRNSNIKVLLDSGLQLDNVFLAGREDITTNYFGGRRKAVNKLLELQKPDSFSIVVDHNPQSFNEVVTNRVDLQLSGHTHNGQFFPFNLIVKFFYEKAYGLLQKGDSTLITSSGLGTWGPPLKLMSRAEVVIVNIN